MNKKISDKDLIEALNGLDSTYDRLSTDAKNIMDVFYTKAAISMNQNDLNKFIKDLQFDMQRMNTDGLYYYNILKKANL